MARILRYPMLRPIDPCQWAVMDRALPKLEHHRATLDFIERVVHVPVRTLTFTEIREMARLIEGGWKPQYG